MTLPEPTPELPPLATALIPRATYRVQFHAGMPLAEATRRVPYLDALGISHLYASPYLKARAGSTHGYDIVDHNTLNPELGSMADLDALSEALRAHRMHQLLDIVPNHMGVLEADNPWWSDVLENGQASAHAHTFDIEWHPAQPELQGQVLLPVLGDHYGRVLEAGELRPCFDAEAGAFHLAYYDHRFPLDPRSYAEIFAQQSPPPGAAGVAEVQALVSQLQLLPPHDGRDPVKIAERQEAIAKLKPLLAQACQRHAWLPEWITACLQRLQGRAGERDSFDALDRLIAAQPYRLAFWRVASDDVNYRRFFDVSTLAAVRMERPEVFEATHRTVMRWLGEGRVDGLRVDHPDGLADPRDYFERLQARYQRELSERGLPPRALYVSVEKILAEHERLPVGWPVHGGTGYRYSNQLNGLFVDSRNEAAFDAIYSGFTGEQAHFGAVLREAKFLVMRTSLASDREWLTEALHRIAQRDRRTRDFTRNRLRATLMEVAAGMPVYRSYIGPAGLADTDRQHLAWATATARRHSPADELSAIDFLRDTLLGAADETDALRRAQNLRFVARWQQFTAPVMAKSMEDTAFYRYHRLISLNDVGGDPRRFGFSPAAFHAENLMRARYLPHTQLGTSTHDSKRSEDVRARLNVLSEMPAEWEAALQRWAAVNGPRAERAGCLIPPNDEYLLYQTLVGVWPLSPVSDDATLATLRERVQAYMRKAAREAKQHTSWINPDPGYETALAGFIDLLLGTREPNPFLTDFEAWLAPLRHFGCWNSLSQVLLKLTSPGVPDIYQGQEDWDFSLVDPDNRRPVDFDARARLLAQVQRFYADGDQLDEGTLAGLRASLPGGPLKLLVTHRLLALRQAEPALFAHGGYQPLEAEGPAAGHVVAFARLHEGRQVLTVAPRLLATQAARDPAGAVGGTGEGSWLKLLPGAPVWWRDAITGRSLRAEPEQADGVPRLDLARVWAALPLAALVAEPDKG